MAKNCAIIPQVRNNQNQIVDSRLFKDLLAYTGNNRNDAVKVYLITKNSDFIENWHPRLILDSNGEPTINSLIKKAGLSNIISDFKILQKLNKDIGHFDSNGNPKFIKYNNQNIQDLVQKANNFNENSDFKDDYVANIVKEKNEDSLDTVVNIKIEKRNKENTQKATKMAYNSSLNNRLSTILKAKGVSIGALTNLEQRMGINGVTDFDIAKNTATGLIEMIRIAEGVQGEKALPEEFAHFAIEAMGDNPLINRLITYIENNNLMFNILSESYDTYVELYNGNKNKLAREAAGKLLAKHLLLQEELINKPYKNLFERVIGAVKNFFKGFNATEIQKAIYDADKQFGNIAKDILNGALDNEINIDNINTSGLYYQTVDRVERDKKLLQDIINNELKRLKIYEKRNPKSSFSTIQRLFIESLDYELITNNEIEGIYNFIDNALSELNKVNNRLEILKNTPVSNINERASVLRDIRNYMYSYKNIISDIRKSLLEEEKYADNRYGNRVRVVLDNTTILLDDLYSKYNEVSKPLFADFVAPFLGNNLVVPFGKHKGKVITAHQLIDMADEDITIFDRWLDSMADSSDIMLKIMDQAVKKSKEKARLDTISIMKELEAAIIKLEQSGVKNTDWMFEINAEGQRTGKYISEIDYALFKKNSREMYKRLEEKYGKNPIGEDLKNYAKERKEWYSQNLETVNGVKRPIYSIYKSNAFIALNPAQQEYYKTIMDIKSRLDALLPDKYTSLLNTIKIRKDVVERVKSSENTVSGAKQIWESIKDDFIRRSDDVDFADRATVKDFEGNAVQTLPIYYTKLGDNETENDISTDVTSTLIAYAAMANDYNQMHKIIDVLELGRDILREREVVQTEGNKSLVEKFKTVGRQVESKLTKKGKETLIIGRLNDFFEMQVYGRYMADEGTFFGSKIDKAKVANFVNKVTSLNNLALNVLSGISNVATGSVMMRIESFSGEFYSEKNTITADRNYGQALPEFLGEIGNRVKTSKLALWDELFNVMQEYETDIRNSNFDRKTWFSQMFGTSSLFFMSNAGEHWMQNRTSLALADNYKMKAPNNKIVSLWEAMEVVYTDPNNKSLGAKLQIKEGYTKADGTAFTQEDIIKFSRKTAAINQRMHGIYNKVDRSAIQRLAVGRLGMMFRKWIKPSLNRRFKTSTYNFDIDSWTEGYYVTTGRFLNQLVTDIRETQFNLAARWEDLNVTEKANIRRAMTEVGHFLAVSLVLGFVDWDGDKDRPWLVRMAEYQTRRLYTELGVLIPGKTMISEGLKIIKSPAAGINTMEDILNLSKLINPFNYMDELQSGRYQGHSTAYKSFFESPVIPMNRTIYKGLNPEIGIPFFKQ